MQNRKCENVAKNANNSRKNGNYAKNENFAKNTEFLITNVKFCRKSFKNLSKKTKFWE